MASTPDILDELPWLKLARRKTRQAKALRHARSVLLLSALGAPLLFAQGHYGWTSGTPGAAVPGDAATPAVIDSPFAPKALRPLTALQAETWNSRIPDAAANVPAATPFAVGTANAQSLSRSLQCMTAAVYYEAGNEPLDGQRAVAQVILNRMRSPVFPHSVCGVVYQGSERRTGCQFTFTCDGSLARVPAAASWARASAVAAAALAGYVYAPVGWATHYHADYVVPYWASSLAKLATVGRHIFYAWKGGGGTGAGFTSRYAGIEPDVAAGLGRGLVQTASAVSDPDGIARVTSAERPLIAFGAADGTAAPAAKATPEALHPTVALGSRWVVGAPAQGLDTGRATTRTLIPATPEEHATAGDAVAAVAPLAGPRQAVPASE